MQWWLSCGGVVAIAVTSHCYLETYRTHLRHDILFAQPPPTTTMHGISRHGNGIASHIELVYFPLSTFSIPSPWNRIHWQTQIYNHSELVVLIYLRLDWILISWPIFHATVWIRMDRVRRMIFDWRLHHLETSLSLPARPLSLSLYGRWPVVSCDGQLAAGGPPLWCYWVAVVFE